MRASEGAAGQISRGTRELSALHLAIYQLIDDLADPIDLRQRVDGVVGNQHVPNSNTDVTLIIPGLATSWRRRTSSRSR